MAHRYGTFLMPLAVLACALIVASPEAMAAGQERVSRTYYKNDQLGFKFLPMHGWTSFPPQPGEKTVVVHFRTEKAERGAGLSYTPECYVYRFTKDDMPSLRDAMERHILSGDEDLEKFSAKARELIVTKSNVNNMVDIFMQGVKRLLPLK